MLTYTISFLFYPIRGDIKLMNFRVVCFSTRIVRKFLSSLFVPKSYLSVTCGIKPVMELNIIL
jgi:hypothetical protein